MNSAHNWNGGDFADQNRGPLPDPKTLAKFGVNDVATERHYTIGEIAELWHMDYKTARGHFENEPGVMEWGNQETRFKRGYINMRVPESVMIRVHRRLRKPM